MADNVEVKLGADASGLISNSKDAAAQVDAALAKIREALLGLGTSSAKADTEVKTHTLSIIASFKEMRDSVVGAVESTNKIIDGMGRAFLAVTAVIAGGALFKEVITEMLSFEASVRSLSITFGTTAEAATHMAIALKLAGIESSTYETMAMHVGRQLKTQSEEFDRLKITIRNTKGEFLPMDEVLQNVYKRMLDFKEGTDQNLFAMTAVGRTAKDFSSDMERLNSVTARATQLQHELGIEMSEDRIAQIERYRVEMNAFHVVLGNIADRIGERVMPALMNMARYFNEIGPAAADVIVFAVKAIITVLDALVAVVKIVLAAFVTAGAAIANRWIVTAQAIKQAAHGDFANAWETMRIGMASVSAQSEKSANQMVAEFEAAMKRINALWADSPMGGSTSGRTAEDRGAGGGRKKGTEDFPLKPKGGGDPAAEWLAKQKDEFVTLQENQGYFNELSKAQEAQFWSDKLAIAKTMGPAYLKVVQEIHRMQFDAAKSAARQELDATIASLEEQKAAHRAGSAASIAIVQQEIDAIIARGAQGTRAYIDAQKRMTEALKAEKAKQVEIERITQAQIEATFDHNIAMYRLAEDQKVALQQESSEQRYAAEGKFLAQEYKQKIEWAQKYIDWLKINDPENEQAIAKASSAKLALEQQYQAKLTELTNKAVQDRLKDELAAADQIRGAFEGLLTSMQTNVKGWRDNFLNAIKAVQAAIAQLVAKKITEQLMGPGTDLGKSLGSLLGTITGTGGAAGATASLTAAGTGLTLAATDLQAAAAALAAANASQAATAGFKGFGDFFDFGVPSLDVGTPYVPQDTLAVVHRGEAVVPAAANVGGGANGPSAFHASFYLSGPVDTRTQDQVAAAAYRGVRRAQQRNA